MNDYLHQNELHASVVLADEIDPRRRALLLDEITNATRRMAKDSLFYYPDYKNGGRPDKTKPISEQLTPEVFIQRAQNVLIKIANKMVGGRSEDDQIRAMSKFEEYVKAIQIGVDRAFMNWDHREISAYLTEHYRDQSVDRGAFLLGMAMGTNMTESSAVQKPPFDMCDYFPQAARDIADKDSVLVTGVGAIRDEIIDMASTGVIRAGRANDHNFDNQLAERGVYLPKARERMKNLAHAQLDGQVTGMLKEIPFPEELQSALQVAVVEIVQEAQLIPLSGGEPQEKEQIKAEAVDLRAGTAWAWQGLAQDVSSVKLPRTPPNETTILDLRAGVSGTLSGEIEDFDNTDIGKKALLVCSAVRALLHSGISHGAPVRNYDEIAKLLLQRPDGPELKTLIEIKIVNALSDVITQSADANLVAGVVGIGESLVKAGSTIDMLAEIQRKIQQKMERLRAEGDAVAEAKSIIQEATKEPSDPAADRVTKIIEAIPEPPQPSSAVEKALELLAKLSPAEKERVLASL